MGKKTEAILPTTQAQVTENAFTGRERKKRESTKYNCKTSAGQREGLKTSHGIGIITNQLL